MKYLVLKDNTTELFQKGSILNAKILNDGTVDYVKIICSNGTEYDLSYETLVAFENAYK